jgi:hypothetical protein
VKSDQVSLRKVSLDRFYICCLLHIYQQTQIFSLVRSRTIQRYLHYNTQGPQHSVQRKLLTYLQENLNLIQDWLKFWRIIHENKSVHVTFTMRAATYPAIYLNGIHIPQAKDIKYLGMYLDN